MKNLVIIDPEAPRGFRRRSYALRVEGKTVRPPALRKFVQVVVKAQRDFAERERLEAAWVQRQLATAPPLTMAQTRMLRRVKSDLIRAAQKT
ncbi:hypothetical protein GQF42_15965 [Streptomyces broussonetiae]|uniref:Uncharacterized protein n=1 Tax=Streptomyces broussonetiae TaxID=2686304 RepID=A0A6I6N834_9ACTN|nr:hypothetical protein [Streptomyces broussonetiae]QHA04586.1 hypothetical protein GQF42_15965 [Streptomyces broussonetiae]